MNELERVIKSPEQVSAEIRRQASDIIENNPEILTEVLSSNGEERLLVTPSYVGSVAPKKDAAVLGQKYAIAAQVDQRGYKRGNPLYLIVNNNTENPLLKFDGTASPLIKLDGSWGGVDDSTATLRTIMKNIEKCAWYDSEKVRHTRARRRKWITFGAAVVVLLGGGGTAYEQAAQNHYAMVRERRADFDAKHMVLDTPGVTREHIAFASQDAALVNGETVPSKTPHDTFKEPRFLKLGSGACHDLKPIVSTDQQVRVVTDAPHDQVYVAVNGDGRVKICSFESDESNDVTYHVVAQITG